MRPAFAEIVDYAGTFPPASCTISDAVRQYDAYRRSSERWMLGRFVVAAIALQYFAQAVTDAGVLIDPADPWRLSVVLGALIPAELALVAAFQAEWEERGILADTVEFKVGSVGQALVVGDLIPHSFRRFFEVPHREPYRELVRAIGSVGAMVKYRTGGMAPDRFPAAEDFTRFLMAVVDENVPFKATAGLHHPYRGVYPISYAEDAPMQAMFGFVNVLLATAELARGGEGETAEAILLEPEAKSIVRGTDFIRWRDVGYSADELAKAHQRYFLGFGSCSFREPYDQLGLGAVA
jgi:hypothetical protein